MQDPQTLTAVSNVTASLSDTIREILRPWNIKREAKAEAYKMRLLADTRLYTASIDAKVEEIQYKNTVSVLQKSTQYVSDESIESEEQQAKVDDSLAIVILRHCQKCI